MERHSTFDALPPSPNADFARAFQELREGKQSEKDILRRLNLYLAMKGIAPISRSSFNRRAVRAKRLKARLDQVRAIFDTMPLIDIDPATEISIISECIREIVSHRDVK